MRLNGFRCDVCCKEHLLEPSLVLASYYDYLPDGWFLLSQGRPEHGKEPLMFCSVACLAQWAEKQATLVHDDYSKALKEPACGGLVTKDWVVKEAPRSSTEVFEGLAQRLQELGEVPRKRLTHGNWLPGDEE